MKYTKEQRLEIGRQIYEGEIKRYEAVEKYDISDYTARDYMRMYRDANHLAPKNGNHSSVIIAAPSKSEPSGIDELEAMSKEELIREIVKARIVEARLKKGYELKGAGTVIRYGKKNIR